MQINKSTFVNLLMSTFLMLKKLEFTDKKTEAFYKTNIWKIQNFWDKIISNEGWIFAYIFFSEFSEYPIDGTWAVAH